MQQHNRPSSGLSVRQIIAIVIFTLIAVDIWNRVNFSMSDQSGALGQYVDESRRGMEEYEKALKEATSP